MVKRVRPFKYRWRIKSLVQCWRSLSFRASDICVQILEKNNNSESNRTEPNFQSHCPFACCPVLFVWRVASSISRHVSNMDLFQLSCLSPPCRASNKSTGRNKCKSFTRCEEKLHPLLVQHWCKIAYISLFIEC